MLCLVGLIRHRKRTACKCQPAPQSPLSALPIRTEQTGLETLQSLSILKNVKFKARIWQIGLRVLSLPPH